MTPKLSQNQISELKETKLNKCCSTTWVVLKTVVAPYSNPKISPLGPQKVKNDPKVKSKSNVRIERNKEDESCSTTWVDFKIVEDAYPNSKSSPLGPQKVKNDPKVKSKSNIRIERNKGTIWVDPKTDIKP